MFIYQFYLEIRKFMREPLSRPVPVKINEKINEKISEKINEKIDTFSITNIKMSLYNTCYIIVDVEKETNQECKGGK